MSVLKRIALVLAGIAAIPIAGYGFMTSPHQQGPPPWSDDLLMTVGLANLWLSGGIMIGAGLFGKHPIIGGAVGFVIVAVLLVRFMAVLGGINAL
jgi:hypothetical protein